MPELPDITIYREALTARVAGRRVQAVHVTSPFVLRSVEPPVAEFAGITVVGIERLGKRIVIACEAELYLVIHLMVAGRLKWTPDGRNPPKGLLSIAFEGGTLTLTEAGSKRRASLTAVSTRAALIAMDRGGLDVLQAGDEEVVARLRLENHTLKRALTDPRLFDGIGNSYSDEILHAARLSPLRLTSRLGDGDARRLANTMRVTLISWTERLRAEVGDGWPEKVTAFRPEMAVHGRFRLPCPVCAAPVQRIRYAENETNYCARCQTGGRVLADRAMSRLLKDDWPRSLDEL
ncbi:MAG TPA: DNA-formamidopyrimidine glycosylase family protein [Gemmatimonadaceae bacterium]|nr:DNA-formamidopyrimidine glycosylase family protein [Gemmatimonadaceae bacterium]